MADRDPNAPPLAPDPNLQGEEPQDDGRDLAEQILEQPPGSQPENLPPAPLARAEPPAEPRYVTPEFIEEREKRQSAERELEQYRAWRAEVERSQQKPAAPEPDPYLQPAEYVERQIQARMTQALQPIQQVMTQLYHQNKFAEAKRQYGDDVATAAYQEFDKTTMPRAEWDSVVYAANPFAAAVEWKQRRDALTALGTDPAKFEQNLREKLLSDPQFLAELRARAAAPNGRDPLPLPPQREQPQPRDDAGRFQPLPSVNRSGSAKAGTPQGLSALANQSDEDLVDEILSSPNPSRR